MVAWGAAMSERVDVLAKRIATLEHRLAQFGHSAADLASMQVELDQFKEARAAVAELIEFKRVALQEFEYLARRHDLPAQDRSRWAALARGCTPP